MNHLTMTALLGVLLVAAGAVLGAVATFTGPLNDGRVLAAVVLVVIGGAFWLLALHLQQTQQRRMIHDAPDHTTSLTGRIR